MKHHNYLKQFMVRLFRNNLHFRSITSKFLDSRIICNSCKEIPQDRPHFFLCKIYFSIVEKLNACFVNLKIFKQPPNITPYFFNPTLSINHPSNLIFVSTMKFMYNLRFYEIEPSLPLVASHISRFVATLVKMYPEDNIWKCCQKIQLMMAYI